MPAERDASGNLVEHRFNSTISPKLQALPGPYQAWGNTVWREFALPYGRASLGWCYWFRELVLYPVLRECHSAALAARQYTPPPAHKLLEDMQQLEADPSLPRDANGNLDKPPPIEENREHDIGHNGRSIRLFRALEFLTGQQALGPMWKDLKTLTMPRHAEWARVLKHEYQREFADQTPHCNLRSLRDQDKHTEWAEDVEADFNYDYGIQDQEWRKHLCDIVNPEIVNCLQNRNYHPMSISAIRTKMDDYERGAPGPSIPPAEQHFNSLSRRAAVHYRLDRARWLADHSQLGYWPGAGAEY
ncbi:hypothetical protein JCM10207_001185 [Rhodosporidiobolus poonsookiae]